MIVGVWHAFLVVKAMIPPFLATLSGFLAYRGLSSFALPAPGAMTRAMQATVMTLVCALVLRSYRDGTPVPVLLGSVVVAVGAVLLGSSRIGRSAIATGGNPEAARLSGIPIARVRLDTGFHPAGSLPRCLR